MSVTSGFFNSLNGDRKYNAEQMSAIFDGIINDGVFANIGTAFTVSATTGLVIQVGIGRAWFNSTWVYNDTILPITLDDSELVLDRIDAVVIEVDRSDAVRAGSIKVVKGTPASTPQNPTLTHTNYAHQYPLAYIYRTAGSTEVTQSAITSMIGTSSCPYITGILQVQNIDNIVAQWGAQWIEWFGSVTGSGEDQINNIINMWYQWYYTQTSTSSAEINEWFNDMKADFVQWFNDLQVTLDGDVAASLAARLLEVENRFDTLAEDQCVFTVIEDSNGNPILDSTGDEIEGKTVFSTGADEEVAKIEKDLNEHMEDGDVHVNVEQKAFWNNKAEVVRVGTATLPLTSWIEDIVSKTFSQVVTISGLTANSKVDFDTDLTNLANVRAAILPVNDNGVLKAVTSRVPRADLSVQVTITETTSSSSGNMQGGGI